MKKLLFTLAICAALGCATASAAPAPALPAAESVSASPAVKGGAGHIYFWAGSSDASFSIYSITGQLIRVVRVGAGNRATIEMPKGFYVVRFGSQWSCKVVVK